MGGDGGEQRHRHRHRNQAMMPPPARRDGNAVLVQYPSRACGPCRSYGFRRISERQRKILEQILVKVRQTIDVVSNNRVISPSPRHVFAIPNSASSEGC